MKSPPFLSLLAATCTACADTGPDDHEINDANHAGGDVATLDAHEDTGDELDDATDPTETFDATDVADATDANRVDAQPVEDEGSGPSIRVVTFNTGTGVEGAHDSGPDDGYSREQAEITDAWYGNGLAWTDFVDDTRAFFDAIDADVVVFQEIFWTGDCPTIPQEAHNGYVCDGWTDSQPTVAQQVLGDGWQVICHPGKPDKCLAVNRRLGSFRGCDGDFCLEGADGFRVDGCGSGSRIGRGVIDRVDGGPPLTIVNIHGSSGFNASDSDCRVRQFEQVFVDFGDGEPAANGETNLVLGDFNTDPVRLNPQDSSAARLTDFVGPGLPFAFVSAVGRTVTPSYAGLFNIDHVVSDVFVGACTSAGIEPPWPAPTEAVFFDHAPLVCDVRLRRNR